MPGSQGSQGNQSGQPAMRVYTLDLGVMDSMLVTAIRLTYRSHKQDHDADLQEAQVIRNRGLPVPFQTVQGQAKVIRFLKEETNSYCIAFA